MPCLGSHRSAPVPSKNRQLPHTWDNSSMMVLSYLQTRKTASSPMVRTLKGSRNILHLPYSCQDRFFWLLKSCQSQCSTSPLTVPNLRLKWFRLIDALLHSLGFALVQNGCLDSYY